METFTHEFNTRMAVRSWTPAHLVAALSDRGIEVTVQAVMRWAAGETMPQSKLVPPIANALGCTANELLGIFSMDDAV